MAAMKGLTQFIADLRELRSHEAEKSRVNAELANIRNKFRDSDLSAYNRKKYIAKLVYIYTLGYQVDFGSSEIVALLGKSPFSEKQIGYLAMTLMLENNRNAVEQSMHTVKNDLASMNDLDTSLALNFVSTLSPAPRELVPEVYKLLVSPTSTSAVHKKAALALLSMYRSDPTCLENSWKDRILALLDSRDIGVAMSVASLVQEVVRHDPERAELAASKATRRLQRILVDGDLPHEYFYYDVPSPWFVVKLFEILQLAPPSHEPAVVAAIRTSVSKVLEWTIAIVPSSTGASTASAGPQHANARNAVVFEAINVFVHSELNDPELLRELLGALQKCLEAKDTNLRYLALNSLVALSSYEGYEELIPRVLKLLRDRDISVRRKALDLLYSSCTGENVEHIAAELLDHLANGELDLRQETVTRLADLIERYATSLQWYVDTTLSLLMVGGSHVGHGVWQRVLQIVVNNEDIQTYATRTALDYVKNPGCSENALKVGTYLLGEYGHLIASDSDRSPLDQFLALQDRAGSASVATKHMILTAYIKFANTFAELRPQLLDAISLYATSTDPELQQRACEYREFLRPENIYLLPTVCDEMPPFNLRESTLAQKLAKSRPALARQATLARGGRNGSRASLATPSASVTHLQSIPTGVASVGTPMGPPEIPASRGAPVPLGAGQGRASISNTPLIGSGTPQELASQSTGASYGFGSALRQTPQSTGKTDLLSSNWEHGYRRMLTHPEAVLYQEALLQVGCKYEFRRQTGCVILYLRNLGSIPLTALSVQISNPMGEDVLSVSTKNMPSSELKPHATAEQVVICEARQPFAVSPICKISYMAGSFNEISFRLPITLERFMEPVSLQPSDFFQRWDQIGAEGEFQKTFRNFSRSKVKAVVTDDADTLGALNWGLLDADPNPNNVVGASILHTTNGGNFGSLCRLEPDGAHDQYRITIRATKKLVAVVLVKGLTNAYQL